MGHPRGRRPARIWHQSRRPEGPAEHGTFTTRHRGYCSRVLDAIPNHPERYRSRLRFAAFIALCAISGRKTEHSGSESPKSTFPPSRYGPDPVAASSRWNLSRVRVDETDIHNIYINNYLFNIDNAIAHRATSMPQSEISMGPAFSAGSVGLRANACLCLASIVHLYRADRFVLARMGLAFLRPSPSQHGPTPSPGGTFSST